jgi:hypothetical protein
MLAVRGRSIWKHCGSLNLLDQWVAGLLSSTALAVVPLFSMEDASANLSVDSNTSGPAGVVAVGPPEPWSTPAEGAALGASLDPGVDPVKTWNSYSE